MSTYTGTTANPTIDIQSTGGVKQKGAGTNISLTSTPTYFYRVLATGIRSTAASLSDIPAGAVIEGIVNS